MLSQSSTRVIPRILRRTLKTSNNTFKPVTSPAHPLNLHTRRMAMFGPRFYTQAEPNFSGLFRLIDEFDNYATQQSEGGGGRRSSSSNSPRGRRGAAAGRQQQQIPTFTPRFDLKETEADFELHGELPGIEKDQVSIEFTEPQTIVIRGRVERTHTAGTPPAGFIGEEGDSSSSSSSDKMSGALLTEAGEQPGASERRSSFNATVENETDEGSTAATTPASTTVELSKSAEQQNQQQQQQQPPKYKYWITERSIGEFSRAFQFPVRVDHDNVRASLNNGILTVTVPKAKQESRRIAIN